MLLAGKLNVKMIDAARPSDQGEYLLGDGGGLHLRIRQGGERGKKVGSSNTPTPLAKRRS